jgi:ABC-2 type transport system permease protein
MKTYHGNSDHPVLQDILDVMRGFAADPAALDAFTQQWFFKVALPEYRLSQPRKSRQGDTWRVTCRVENAGTGAMPVEIAASRGQRFDKAGKANPDYQEARTAQTLGASESRECAIKCGFEPETIIVDSDAKELQFQRKNAVAGF